MKRSIQVTAPLLAAAAAGLLTGCQHPPEMQRCVDENNRVVAESFCQANGVAPKPAVGTGGYGGGMMYLPHYRYYYGGGGGWGLGSSVFGGGYAPLTGHPYTRSSAAAHSESFGGRVGSTTARGGFGSTHGGGSAHGGGGGGE